MSPQRIYSFHVIFIQKLNRNVTYRTSLTPQLVTVCTQLLTTGGRGEGKLIGKSGICTQDMHLRH